MEANTWKVRRPAGWWCRYPKARTTGADDFYNVQQVAKGAGKAIIVAHDDHVAATKLIKQPVQRWPLPGCAGQRI